MIGYHMILTLLRYKIEIQAWNIWNVEEKLFEVQTLVLDYTTSTRADGQVTEFRLIFGFTIFVWIT